ncbi:MAG: 3-isopropylmalate dehydratase small subunit [Comamonadaceae bacterium]|nr:MAG: 3-isopropylmalate dehydratase small subunit [Comamonadaceae bacterium]
MKKFTVLTAIAAPLMRQNVDTDIIVRIERLIGHGRDDLGRFCFEAWRYGTDGRENPDFILNMAPYRESKILLAGANFGCGSSREGAVWALMGIGMRCVIAPSFGDIFYNNCFQNAMLPVVLPMPVIESIADQVALDPARNLVSVDLVRCTVQDPNGERHGFSIDPMRQQALLEGCDEIALSLSRSSEIAAFQIRDRQQRPWAYLAR